MLENWNLIKELTWSDFKLRYNSSILGFLWSFIKPLLMLTILYIVFSLLIKIKIENYALFLLLGIILWNFFYESTTISMNNMLAKRNLIKNVYFKRKVLVISSCLNALIALIFNLIIFLIIASVVKVRISLIPIGVLISMVLVLFIISLGISYILSSFYVKYRDLTHIWDVFLQLGFFITPIAYSTSIIPQRYLFSYMLNPLARILTYSREAMFYELYPSLLGFFSIIVFSLIVYFIGLVIYKKRSKYFAEEI
jgi:lipopolysaccharide transport system permease protein